MTSLKKLQEEFISSVRESEASENIAEEIAEGKVSKNSLIKIYSNNLYKGRNGTLANIYPSIKTLVGEKFFNSCTREYVRLTPSTSGNLEDYGEEFPVFLGEFPPAKKLAYLPDVARFEWLYHKCLLTEKDETIAAEKLQTLTPEECAKIKFIFNSSTVFFESKFPILKIWQMGNKPDPEKLDLDKERGERLLILRRDNDVNFIPLDSAEFSFLKSLKDGQLLEQAFDAASEHDKEFDLAFYINRHIVAGTFADIEMMGK